MKTNLNLHSSVEALGPSRSVGATEVSVSLNSILADIFALFIKTKNFHWHVSGPHFRDYHLLLDDQASQLYAMTDVLAERVRKTGSTTLRSISHIARLQTILDNDTDSVAPADMFTELIRDNEAIVREMRATHRLCEQSGDWASASVLENYIDQGEGRVWFLCETANLETPPENASGQ